jgi:hypothetical protein
MTGYIPVATDVATHSVATIAVDIVVYTRTVDTAIIRIVMIYRIAPAITPCRIIMPTPSPVVPAIVAMTIVWSIPSIPRIVPRIVPAVAVIPIPGIYEMYTMVTSQT